MKRLISILMVMFIFIVGCDYEEEQTLTYRITGEYEAASIMVWDHGEVPVEFEQVSDEFVFSYQFIKSDLMYYKAVVSSEQTGYKLIEVLVDGEITGSSECVNRKECIIVGCYGYDTVTTTVILNE